MFLNIFYILPLYQRGYYTYGNTMDGGVKLKFTGDHGNVALNSSHFEVPRVVIWLEIGTLL